MTSRSIAAAIAGLAALLAAPVAAQQIVSNGVQLSADAARDGRVAVDLAGGIWIVPRRGGKAESISPNLRSAQRPRWSPNASEIAFQAVSQRTQGIWVYCFDTGESRRVSRDASFDMHPSWHPNGERVVYASDAAGRGLDLWEVDLPSGLHWRLSDRPGDESDPAWSSDGRDLVYVHRHVDEWSLILRRQGQPEEILISTTERLSGPAWRPDGSLISFFRDGEMGRTLDIVILAEPRLIRQYASGEAFGSSPVSWLDRHRMIYSAGGVIRQRVFNAWTSSTLPFNAPIKAEEPATLAQQPKRRSLPRIDEPGGRLVIHAARFFDGVGGGYQADRDIIIDGGRITAIEPHSDGRNSVVIDMGDLTVLPGYIDAHADLSYVIGKYGDRSGPLLLANGVTTIAAAVDDSERLNAIWSGKKMPGPRLLNTAEWPAPPLQSVADAITPGLNALLQSRQGRLVPMSGTVARRFSEPLDLRARASGVVLSSFENGLPAGIGLHAELRALVAAGLKPEQSLKAAGVNAAAALRLDPLLGRIGVGAAADLVFVDGDPLLGVEAAVNVVAVVRNGRFFSVSGLLDRADPVESVE